MLIFLSFFCPYISSHENESFCEVPFVEEAFQVVKSMHSIKALVLMGCLLFSIESISKLLVVMLLFC